MKISASEALEKLMASGKLFLEMYTHGTLSVEVYKPIEVDLQKPHDRDEVYVVISGFGTFLSGDTRHPFQPGDFLFVPAGTDHRFENFSEDFATWVIFYGPPGGESEILSDLID